MLKQLIKLLVREVTLLPTFILNLILFLPHSQNYLVNLQIFFFSL